jgi:GNAT superfamily N-acetyltransferase
MPDTDSKPAATWSLSQFERIDLTYTTDDRYGHDWVYGDPDRKFAQSIRGDVVGIAFPDNAPELHVPLGTVELAKIDLWEVEQHGESIAMVLDSHSADWVEFFPLVDEDTCPLDHEAHSLVIADRVRIVPEARGHRLGLHVLARALRTWAEGDSLGVIGLVAGTTEREELAEPSEEEWNNVLLPIGEKLAAYWGRLGFERLDPAVATTRLPMLYADVDYAPFWRTIDGYCGEWQSPAGES